MIASFGFRLVEARLAVYVVAANLPSGVRVIKMQGRDGVEYNVCDADLMPVCLVGRTLEDLRDA